MEWGFLFYTIKAFGFGKNLITYVKLLFSSPVASVKTNSTQSVYIPLHRSTRQGCPLSPLLFALAIEPLSIVLCCDSHITGIFRNGVEQRVSLYADDLLLYISNFSVSIPAALTILDSKFLYLFQCLSIFLTHALFCKIDTILDILDRFWN